MLKAEKQMRCRVDKPRRIHQDTASNIWRMKQFHEVYDDDKKLSTLWTELPWNHNHRIMTLKTAEEHDFNPYFPNFGTQCDPNYL